MQATIPLGRLFGIPIGLHYSWFIIAALLTLSAASQFGQIQRAWSPGLVWSAAGTTALLFFASIVAHELAHALVALRAGLPVRSITLFALGGIALIARQAASPRVEFAVAVAGPIASIAIGAFCWWASAWPLWSGDAAVAPVILQWLGFMNLALGIFNLIPGYPLDGGRMLRAVLWALQRDLLRATRQAAQVGQVVAVVFILLGLLRFFTGAGLGGLWIAFIGWFLLQAAQGSYAEMAVSELLREVTVDDIMGRDCIEVDEHTPLQQFVHRLLEHDAAHCGLVTRETEVIGLVTPREAARVESGSWPHTPVTAVMRPLNRMKTITPAASAGEALELMTREDVHQLPVVAAGRLEGVVTRARILELLQDRTDVG